MESTPEAALLIIGIVQAADEALREHWTDTIADLHETSTRGPLSSI